MTKAANAQPAFELPPVVRTSAGLRSVLFDELDRMRSGKTNATNANAIARLVGEIVNTIQMELEVHKQMARVPGEGPKITFPMPLELGMDRREQDRT